MKVAATMLRILNIVGVGLLVACAASAQGTSGPATPPQVHLPQTVDSGYLDNRAATARVVFKHTFKLRNSAWLQLKFGELTNLPSGSTLRIFGTKDQVSQRHDGRSIGDYGMWSAGFNGEEIVLELVAGANTQGNRVQVEKLVRGLPAPTPMAETICGPTDDRVQSNDPRQGRMWLGCTGWLAGIISGGSRNLMISAGHCAGGSTILEFNVPNSTAGGTVVRAAPNDQYPYQILGRLDAGIGADWMVATVGPNSNTNQIPTDVNGGVYYNLGPVPGSTSGQSITITGYGVSNIGRLSQVQKIHTGPLAQIGATSLCYATDTTGGNSGSPVIQTSTGNAIGIHSHGGCGVSGGCNSGTRIDRADLRAVIASAGQGSGVFKTFGSGCPGSGSTSTTCSSLNPNGGSLRLATTANEIAYIATAPSALDVVEFEIYSVAVGGSQIVPAAIYAANGQAPGARLASGTITIGGSPGFYAAKLSARVPAGRFFIAVDHSSLNTAVSDLSIGTRGGAYARSPGGSWSSTTLVSRPAYRVRCSGGSAVPAMGNTGLPRINNSFSVNLTQAAPTAPAVLIVGASNTVWAGGPLPWSLAVIGGPGCDLLVSPHFQVVGTRTDATGAGSLAVPIANVPTLVGQRGFVQWYVIDQGNNAANIAVSDGGDVTIGR